MKTIIEGNFRPGNPLTGDDKPEPVQCPLCGKHFTHYAWGNEAKYRYLTCYGRKPRFLVWLYKRAWSITDPKGCHYAFKLPVLPVTMVDFLLESFRKNDVFGVKNGPKSE